MSLSKSYCPNQDDLVWAICRLVQLDEVCMRPTIGDYNMLLHLFTLLVLHGEKENISLLMTFMMDKPGETVPLRKITQNWAAKKEFELKNASLKCDLYSINELAQRTTKLKQSLRQLNEVDDWKDIIKLVKIM